MTERYFTYIFIVSENITLLPIVIVDKYACR